VPMDPEWLPVLALFLIGLFAGTIAVYCIRSREARKGFVLLVAGSGMIALALMIVRQRSTVLAPATALTPASLSAAGDPEDPDSTSMSLRLGGVTLRVAHADRYVLSIRKRRLLELDSDRKGLWVSCEVKPTSRGPMYSPLGGTSGEIACASPRFPFRDLMPTRSSWEARARRPSGCAM
jgi:hypothetical protein